MPFPAPVLPIVGPIAAAFVILLLGRWPRTQTLAGSGAAFIFAFWIAILPLDSVPSGQELGLFSGNTWLLAGRPLLINEGLQTLFVFFFVALGLLFLLSLSFSQGPSFVPAGLAAISPIAAALMVRLFAFGAILLVVAVTLLVMTYVPVIRLKTLGSLRYLLFSVLALVPLLLAGWLFESGQAALFSPLIVTMLAVGFAVLLAGFPFYIWVYPIIAEVPFLIPALILGLAQTAVITFIFSLLQINPWLQENSQFQSWLGWSGTGTVLVAALLVLTAGQWRFLLGHLLLLNMGMAVLTLTLPMQVAWDIAILFHLSRFVSLLIAGIGMSFLQQQGRGETIADSHGLGRQAPLTAALLGYSFFSLLGTPLTIGFPAQWAIITTFGQQSNVWLPALLVLALGVSAYQVLRVLAALMQNGDSEPGKREPDWQRALAAAILILAALLALFPQPLLSYAKELSTAIVG
jgi:NADH:ubiquinone oxidoreductase subunit 2 (subunit N)